jgi:uncharacterized repeat protein (TIGR01451 family)
VARGVPASRTLPAGLALALVAAAAFGQGPPAGLTPTPAEGVPAFPGAEAPGSAVVGEASVAPADAVALLPPDVQVVRFQGPAGIKVEVLGPAPEAVPIGDGHGLATYGLRVGVAYQLRLSNLPGREGAELYPMIEVVGHLHRPPSIDPGKYPIRVQLDETDLEDVLVRGRMVTQVVYLEDPEQALPIHLPKDEIPVVSLSPAEDPLKVAAALGRPMAILRLGTRTPAPEDLGGAPFEPIVGPRCPFAASTGGPCALPCGPARGTPPPPGRPWAPADEYLCDGGDHGPAGKFGGDGNLKGIEPRDTILRFRDDVRARLLPTNTVCLYAPRFAAVRVGLGANQNVFVEVAAGHDTIAGPELREARQGPRRMTQNTAAVLGRHRSRASEVEHEQFAAAAAEVRVLAGMDTFDHIGGHVLVQGPEFRENRVRAVNQQRNAMTQGIKNAETAVVSGIVAGANEEVMAWKPQEAVGVEVPPNRPGMAVVKQILESEAEPGDVVTVTIRFRNMGNVPIRDVSVVDDLLPRLEYVAGTAQGPKGTVFTAAPNEAGSMELRWDLPEPLDPGVEGLVTFRALVR